MPQLLIWPNEDRRHETSMNWTMLFDSSGFSIFICIMFSINFDTISDEYGSWTSECSIYRYVGHVWRVIGQCPPHTQLCFNVSCPPWPMLARTFGWTRLWILPRMLHCFGVAWPVLCVKLRRYGRRSSNLQCDLLWFCGVFIVSCISVMPRGL